MKPASTQTDRNMNFDGIGEGPKKGSSRFAHNHWSGHSNDGRLVNKGRGPTRGNQEYAGIGGKSVTKDARRLPPTDGLPASTKIRNPDYINGGAQDRGVGGTSVKKPSNPDQIRVGQNGGTSYGAVSRGSRPVAAGQTDGINYGPKKQY